MRKGCQALVRAAGLAMAAICCLSASAQTLTVSIPPSGGHQVIDGFGTAMWQSVPEQPWFAPLYFDDLGASMVRVDLTPQFKPPYSGENGTYNSPWPHNNPALPGPDGNNVRAYKDAADYGRSFNGWKAPIAVMGPDIDENIRRCFNYEGDGKPRAAGKLAAIGQKRFGPDQMKLIGAMWSPAPWLKIASGNKINAHHTGVLPKDSAPWPFIWFNNFAGGVLDTSDKPIPEFDDSALTGGTGPTSALTQFARCTAAYVKGYQDRFGVKFYAISIQNEPNLELFYDTCLYRTTDQYLAALKVVRAEFDRHPELQHIKLIGPEDAIGSESSYLWVWTNNNFPQAKFLQFMQAIEGDPVASRALALYCNHGYAQDGIGFAGAVPQVWRWCANGWDSKPHPAVPEHVKGYRDFGKTCWMTETSGEQTDWLAPKGAFPNRGAFAIALKIHQALTEGDVSAWLYWQCASHQNVEGGSLTDGTLKANSPKFAAARHYFRYIRPGARRIDAAIADAPTLAASAFIHEHHNTLTIVVLNLSPEPAHAALKLPPAFADATLKGFTSSSDSLWQASSLEEGKAISVPGYGVMTVVASK